MQINVAIVEDDLRVRQELARLIDRAEGFKCLGVYSDGESALAEIPRLREAFWHDLRLCRKSNRTSF